MRERLSDMIAGAAEEDSRTIVLSGDHGYALFDKIRNTRPDQFINVGVSEQAMVGYAAGLAKLGFRPIVYGLAAFVPVRVLEQIKLDVCLSGLPVVFLGDGAGLVYSYLGASHHCAEDVACLRSLPRMRIYSPCDAAELETCFREASDLTGPAYIRIGKSDRPPVHAESPADTEPRRILNGAVKVCIVATGSMTAAAVDIGRDLDVSVISVPRLKPFSASILAMVDGSDLVVSMEEHSRHGGLGSSLAEAFASASTPCPRLEIIGLQEKFAARCGSWQYALSEHDMSDEQLHRRISTLVSRHAVLSAL